MLQGQGTHRPDGLVAISSASHAEGRGFDPRSGYAFLPSAPMHFFYGMENLVVSGCASMFHSPALGPGLGSYAHVLKQEGHTTEIASHAEEKGARATLRVIQNDTVVSIEEFS